MRFLLLLLFGTAIGFQTSAQKLKSTTPKIPLTHDVYDLWKEIPYKAISNDGQVIAIMVNPGEGDGKLAIFHTTTKKADTIRRAAEVVVMWDSRNVIAKVKPPYQLVKDLRRQKKKKEDLPKDSLAIYDVSTRKVSKVAQVRSFKVPERAGGWMAYLVESPKPKPDTSKVKPAKKPKAENEENGFALKVRDLKSGKVISIKYVKEYSFARLGKRLLFVTTGTDSLKAGVYSISYPDYSITKVYNGSAKYAYKGLILSEDAEWGGFTVDEDSTKALVRNPKIYLWNPTFGLRLLADEKSPGVPQGWKVNDSRTIQFAKDNSKVFLGLNPTQKVRDTTLLPEEIPQVEVWGWRDPQIYPVQNRRLDETRKQSYIAVYHLATNKLNPIADPEIPNFSIADEGRASIGLLTTSKPYEWADFHDRTTTQDVYVADLQTGQRTVVMKNVKGTVRISPKAKFIFWFSLPDSAWHSYNVATGKTVNLTESLKVKFADELIDTPEFPEEYGYAGWTEDDSRIWIYDRYDIWSFDPTGAEAPVNLTKSGRSTKTVYRYQRLNPDERNIPTTSDAILSVFNEVSRQEGFARLTPKTGLLQNLIITDHSYAGLQKSLNAGGYIYSRESFTEFRDIWFASEGMANPTRITTANPQQSKYLWGSVELVKWTNLDNVEMEGLLYKPENFDPKKKYPMITYFYERSSQELHYHSAPIPSRSTINYSFYTSNGYIVFVPDIIYKIGYPGESAYNSIMPGIASILAKGYVDQARLGVQGHSWGGYQAAYLVTRTNLFAAAEAGAPVVNMTSAYGGIRWGTGLSRMFQYEHSQSRIGGTLWQKHLQYIENSPLFFADKVQTPVLMMHNDGDGAVPWYQGIEFYMALRRLEKPVWMLNYNNQDHNLNQRQDRKDLSIRMQQFFDHYLKGAPMPSWMKGLPAVEKGITSGY